MTKADRARHLALVRKYGLTIQQYEKMLVLQGGGCALCGRKPKTRRLAVDHDHGPSKAVRGALCLRCNRFYVAKNTVETARQVLAYLASGFDGRTL